MFLTKIKVFKQFIPGFLYDSHKSLKNLELATQTLNLSLGYEKCQETFRYYRLSSESSM